MADEPTQDRDDEHIPIPQPSEAKPDATTQGVDERVEVTDDEVTEVTEGTGPGAGEGPMVRVTTPRPDDDEDVPRHPTLR